LNALLSCDAPIFIGRVWWPLAFIDMTFVVIIKEGRLAKV